MSPRVIAGPLTALLLCAAAAAPAAEVAPEPPDAGALVPELVLPTAQCPGLPRYPEAEQGSRVRGAVKVRITLGEDGAIADAQVFESLGAAFDVAALDSVRQCTFTPALQRGKAVPSILEMAVDFVPPPEPWVLTGEVVGELGEALEGASVRFAGQEVRTDAKGAFRLSFEAVPPGEEWVLVEKDGYALKGFPEVYAPGRTTRSRYALVKEKVFETRVAGSRLLPPIPDADKTPQVSRTYITRADLDRIPGALEDVSRVVQATPGVAADPDLLATFFVRGGGPDETVFYIDGVPLQNPYHLGGFASVFNPMVIESAEFYAGGAPARYEPSLSGVFEVKYVSQPVQKPALQADVSMQSAKARVDVPTGIEGLSATVSFRRSYFELYFEILKALGVVGSSVVAPDITEGFARLIFQRGRHTTLATLIHTSDGMNFVVKPGEEVLVNFAGGLQLKNMSHVVSLQHRVDLAGDSAFEVTGAFTHDSNVVKVDSVRRFANEAERAEVMVRGDLTLAHSRQNRTQVGLQYSWRRLELVGEVGDTRGVAPWLSEPFVESYRPYVSINPLVSRALLALYAEHTWRPVEVFAVEAGARGQYDALLAQASGSARLAASVTLPTATVLKLSGGLAAQPVQSPLLLDPVAGNPDLEPERVFTLVGAIEQPLPFEAFLKVEGWGKWLGGLAVNPDTRAGLEERLAQGLPAYASVGRGKAWGVDGALVGRTRHFHYGASFGVLFSERENPLAAGTARYPTPWDQRFTAAASLSWSPTSRWIFTGRANLRTGRPYTPVADFTRDDENARWLPVFGEPNSERYALFFELSLRGEHRFKLGPAQLGVYLEVLNVTNTTNVFSWVYGSGDLAAGTPPDRVAFNHLPIRPFLGLKGEL